MIYIESIIALCLFGAFIHFYLTRKNSDLKNELLAEHINSNYEIKRTLAMGLYLRFRKENIENPPKYSELYIKEDPLTFESFVANIIEKTKGGTTWVSPPSGDFGVDFEHRTDDGLFLGQVKCYQDDLPFEPISLIHSNMIKKGAIGGYVITTGSFTSAAKDYANGLNIDLIDGVNLIELWLDSLRSAEKDIKQLIPEIV